jgi:U3 small nucleolar RNA-associated protein 24
MGWDSWLERVARDPRFERLPCTHKGTYADDCIVQRVTAVRVLDH